MSILDSELFLLLLSILLGMGITASAPHQLPTGTPQGSILGLLLYAIYRTLLGPIIHSADG